MSTSVEVKMEVLDGLRSDVTVYHISDFLYKLTKTLNMKKYFSCIKNSCRASYIIDTKTNVARLLRSHNHSPDKSAVEQYKFLTRLRQRARAENIVPRALFAECLLGVSPETFKRIGSFEKHKKIIYKARNSSPLFGVKEAKQSIKVVKPEFTVLDGLRSDTKIYLCDGFLYFFRKSFNHKNYHDCIEKTCPAKLTYDSSTQDAVITKAHNHASDGATIEYFKFLTKIRTRARDDTIGAREAFTECVKELSPEAAAKVGSFERHKKIMYNARNNLTKVVQNLDDSEDVEEKRWVPETLWELKNAIDKPSKYKHHASELKHLQRIFLRFYDDGDDPQLIFVSSSMKNYVAFISQESGGLNIHIDTSFNINPKHNFHVCCLNILYKKMIFPLIFSIMMGKSLNAFTNLLKKFNEIKGANVDVYSVVTDCQSELDEALKAVFPDSILKGSWFHFAKATLTEAQQAKSAFTEDANIEKAIKMSMVLPLLPNNYYREGVNFVKNYAPLPQTFINYLTDSWKNANISVFGEDVGLHYSIELFSMDIQRVVGADHSDAWKFMEAFLKIFHEKSSAFANVKEEANITVYRNTYIELINEIEEGQSRFLKTHNVGDLLQNLCECMKGLSESTPSFKEESFTEPDEHMKEEETSSIDSIKMEESDCEFNEDDDDEEIQEDIEEIILLVVSEDEEEM